MTSPAFFGAFAEVIASHDMLHALYAEPDRVRLKYALSEDELAMLRGMTPAGFHISHGIVRGKRFAALEMSMPQTMAVLAQFDRYRLVNSFVDASLTRPDIDLVRPITLRREFLGWLAERPGELPAGLLDLTRFEMAVVDLWGDHDAALAAREKSTEVPEPVDLGDQARPILTPDARVERFEIDVLGLPRECSLAALLAADRRPGGVLLRKVWEKPRPLAHRIGVATADLLAGCDGRHTVATLLDRVAGDDPSLRERARAALHGVARLSILSTAKPTR